MVGIGSVSTNAATVPVPVAELSKSQADSTNAVSYLAPLVYEHEHDYTPWTPRIGKITCEPATERLADGQQPVDRLGRVQPAVKSENASGLPQTLETKTGG